MLLLLLVLVLVLVLLLCCCCCSFYAVILNEVKDPRIPHPYLVLSTEAHRSGEIPTFTLARSQKPKIMPPTLATFNALDASAAAAAILPCNGSLAWATQLAALRPFATPFDLTCTADIVLARPTRPPTSSKPSTPIPASASTAPNPPPKRA